MCNSNESRVRWPLSRDLCFDIFQTLSLLSFTANYEATEEGERYSGTASYTLQALQSQGRQSGYHPTFKFSRAQKD